MKGTASIRQPIGRALVLAALAGIVGTAVWTWQGSRPGRGAQDRPLEGLRILGTVPDFSLIERGGLRVSLADLRGKVWIANFIYTHCTDTCPLQSAQLGRLQEELKPEPDVRLVSITVDPEQDTLEVLSEYATRFGADRERWLFLTGDKRAIYALAVEGFRLGVADPEKSDQGPPGKRGPSGRPQAHQGGSSQQRDGRADLVARFLRTAAGSLFEPAPALAHHGVPGKPFLHSSRFVVVDGQARIRGYYQSNDEEALGRLRRDVRTLLRETRP